MYAEGKPPSKKVKRSLDEHQSLYAINLVGVSARSSYFEKLLESPAKLPWSVKELQDFLSLRPVKLPLIKNLTYKNLCQPELVIIDPSEAAISLAIFSEFLFHMMGSPCPANEATGSAQLYHLTGDFLNFLNDNAPADGKLQGLDLILDSGNPMSSEAA